MVMELLCTTCPLRFTVVFPYPWSNSGSQSFPTSQPVQVFVSTFSSIEDLQSEDGRYFWRLIINKLAGKESRRTRNIVVTTFSLSISLNLTLNSKVIAHYSEARNTQKYTCKLGRWRLWVIRKFEKRMRLDAPFCTLLSELWKGWRCSQWENDFKHWKGKIPGLKSIVNGCGGPSWYFFWLIIIVAFLIGCKKARLMSRW